MHYSSNCATSKSNEGRWTERIDVGHQVEQVNLLFFFYSIRCSNDSLMYWFGIRKTFDVSSLSIDSNKLTEWDEGIVFFWPDSFTSHFIRVRLIDVLWMDIGKSMRRIFVRQIDIDHDDDDDENSSSVCIDRQLNCSKERKKVSSSANQIVVDVSSSCSFPFSMRSYDKMKVLSESL